MLRTTDARMLCDLTLATTVRSIPVWAYIQWYLAFVFLYWETVAGVFNTLTFSYTTPCEVINHSPTDRGYKTDMRPGTWKLTVSWERPVGLGTPIPTPYTMTLEIGLHQRPRASLDFHAEISRNLPKDLKQWRKTTKFDTMQSFLGYVHI